MKNIIKFIFFKAKKKFSVGLHSFGGRNFLGRICVYHQGGGNKLRYKFIDRYRRLNQSAYVYKIFRQSSFTAFIGMVIYDNGLISFILLSHGLSKGSRIFSGVAYMEKKDFSIGSSNLVKFFGLFSIVNSVELYPFSGFKLVRAAGCSAYIIKKTKDKAFLKLNSGWQIRISLGCVSSFGICSNPLNKFNIVGKAGKNR